MYLKGDSVVKMVRETMILAPLIFVKMPKCFVVNIRWAVDKKDSGLADRPFHLSREMKIIPYHALADPSILSCKRRWRLINSNTPSIAPTRCNLNFTNFLPP